MATIHLCSVLSCRGNQLCAPQPVVDIASNQFVKPNPLGPDLIKGLRNSLPFSANCWLRKFLYTYFGIAPFPTLPPPPPPLGDLCRRSVELDVAGSAAPRWVWSNASGGVHYQLVCCMQCSNEPANSSLCPGHSSLQCNGTDHIAPIACNSLPPLFFSLHTSHNLAIPSPAPPFAMYRMALALSTLCSRPAMCTPCPQVGRVTMVPGLWSCWQCPVWAGLLCIVSCSLQMTEWW